MSVPTIIISPAAANALPGIDKYKLTSNVTKLRKKPILVSVDPIDLAAIETTVPPIQTFLDLS